MSQNDLLSVRVSFERRLHTAILNTYSRDSLATLVRLDMQVDLETVTKSADFETVATEFIKWTNQEGRMDEFLDKAIIDKPTRPDLAKLRDEYRINCQISTKSSERAVADGSSRDIAEFATAFRQRVPVFGYLKAYKSLHDVLHKLDGDLAPLELEAKAWWADGVEVSNESKKKLSKYATEAVTAARKTDLSEDLGEMMGYLKSAVERFLSTDDRKQRQLAFAIIENMPAQKMGELNSSIVRCTKDLDLPRLLTLGSHVRNASAGKIVDLIADFSTPAEKLTAQVRDHNLCQRIDLELRKVETEEMQTAEEIPFSPDLLKWLSELSNNRKNDDQLAEIVKAANAFKVGTAAASSLLLNFKQFFMAADETLLWQISEMLDAVPPLLNLPEMRS